MQAVWWLVLIVSVLVFLLLAGIGFPKLFLKAEYEVCKVADRGLKNFKEDKGRSIVYEPDPAYAPYVKQYILSERNDKKVILCRLEQNVCYLDYDLVLFDRKERIFKVLNVKERISKPGYTRILELPQRTAYTALVLNAADDIRIDNEGAKKLPKRRLAFFSLCTAALVVAVVFLAKLCLANIFGGVYRQDFLSQAGNIIITAVIGLIAAAVCVAFALLYGRHRRKKQSAKGR